MPAEKETTKANKQDDSDRDKYDKPFPKTGGHQWHQHISDHSKREDSCSCMSTGEGWIGNDDAHLGIGSMTLKVASENIPNRTFTTPADDDHGNFTPETLIKKVQNEKPGTDFNELLAHKETKENKLIDTVGSFLGLSM